MSLWAVSSTRRVAVVRSAANELDQVGGQGDAAVSDRDVEAGGSSGVCSSRIGPAQQTTSSASRTAPVAVPTRGAAPGLVSQAHDEARVAGQHVRAVALGARDQPGDQRFG